MLQLSKGSNLLIGSGCFPMSFEKALEHSNNNLSILPEQLVDLRFLNDNGHTQDSETTMFVPFMYYKIRCSGLLCTPFSCDESCNRKGWTSCWLPQPVQLKF